MSPRARATLAATKLDTLHFWMCPIHGILDGSVVLFGDCLTGRPTARVNIFYHDKLVLRGNALPNHVYLRVEKDRDLPGLHDGRIRFHRSQFYRQVTLVWTALVRAEASKQIYLTKKVILTYISTSPYRRMLANASSGGPWSRRFVLRAPQPIVGHFRRQLVPEDANQKSKQLHALNGVPATVIFMKTPGVLSHPAPSHRPPNL
jgi:hypothetical protein